MFQVTDGIKAYIGPSPLEISMKDLSNGMWKSMNGSWDQKLLIVKVRILISLEAGQILEPDEEAEFQTVGVSGCWKGGILECWNIERSKY